MTKQSYSHRYLAPVASSPLAATVSLPASKSLNNRELVLSALAKEPSVLVSPLVSRDSSLMIEALSALGCKISLGQDVLAVEPHALRGGASINCGLAGTVMRFVPPLAALATGDVSFDGDQAARARPMSTTIESLRSLGIRVSGDGLPFTVHGEGKVRGGEVQIDASASSQFVSGLLLAGARFEQGLTVIHRGNHLPSLPHIDMTIDCLQKRGVRAARIGEASWRVEPGEISGGTVPIEPDLSNAGPFLAAAMVAGGSVRVRNWPNNTTQVGDHFIRILSAMGATVVRDGGDLVLESDGTIKGIDIDLSEGGELTPVIAALAALADGESVIRGVSHLRGHETDRLKALSQEINSLGGDAAETADGLIIRPRPLHGGSWRSYEDHRMATTGCIIGLRIEGVEIDDISVTSKTMPEFPRLWQQLLGGKS